MKNDLIKHYLDNPEELPDRAYTTLPSDPTEVIIVVRGESGYYHYQKYPNKEMAKGTCDYFNEHYNATPEMVHALTLLSMKKTPLE
jgi:hypothetical protein